MKKFFIFFIIMVSIITFALTRSGKINEEEVVSDTELKEYRNSLMINFKKYGYNLTEEEINQKVQEYKETQINIAKSKAKGMDTKQAWKISLIISSISCVLLFGVFSLKEVKYNELFGSSFGSDNTNDNMKKLRGFFFDK